MACSVSRGFVLFHSFILQQRHVRHLCDLDDWSHGDDEMQAQERSWSRGTLKRRIANNSLAIDESRNENDWRKHHTSSVTRDIWVYDMKTKKYTQITS